LSPVPSDADRVEGSVAEFEVDRGTGTVEAGDGRRLFFHCTAIADGTRTIAAGTRVSYVVLPGHLGHWEAGDLRPV
jgi:cold shock CspA family protein